MDELLAFIERTWPWLAGIGATVAATASFFVDIVSLRDKTRPEVKESPIHRPSLADIEKYGKKYGNLRRGTTIIGLLLAAARFQSLVFARRSDHLAISMCGIWELEND